jgi:hypothetical protein
MKLKIWVIASLLFLLQLVAWGGKTKYVNLEGLSDFAKGERENIAIDKLGRIRLSPESKEIFSNKDLLVYSILKINDNLYIGTGNKDILYRYNLKTEKWKNLYEGKGLAVNTLTADENNLYFAESPSNQIYRMNLKTEKIEKLTIFDTETYVWRLLFHNGKLYAATGDSAKIYEIEKDGKKRELFANETENHFLTLSAFRGKLYFGGEGKGAIYEMDIKSGKVNALYDTYEDEINDIYIDKKGKLFFVTSSQTPKKPGKDFDYTDSFAVQYQTKKNGKSSDNKKNDKKKQIIKNSVYTYENGTIDKLFTRDNTVFYSITQDKDGNLYVGGAGGAIYRYNTEENRLSLFINYKEEQILELLPDDDKMYVGTGNLGKVFALNYTYANKGVFTSQITDLGGESRLGRISWDGDAPKDTAIEVYLRGGNSESADKSWSQWTGPYTNPEGSIVSLNSVRYVQYQIRLLSNSPYKTPYLESLTQPYMNENRAPSVSFFRVTFDSKNKKTPPYILTLRWNAYDSDGDKLVFRLFFREKGDDFWLPLTEKVYDNQFLLDTRILPDGNYQMKLQVSDELNNVPSEKQITEEISQTVTLDNHSPSVKITATKDMGDFIRIEGKIQDNTSLISRGYYSVNAEDWTFFLPADSIYDSKEENFAISIPKKELEKNSKSNIVFIRVFDAEDNQSSIRIKINGKGKALD